MPDNYVLSQNYPNPFNPVTTISWYVPIDGNQSLTIYDVLGNQVLKLFDEFRIAGDYKLELNSAGLTSGIYYYQLKAGSFIDTKKMILLK